MPQPIKIDLDRYSRSRFSDEANDTRIRLDMAAIGRQITSGLLAPDAVTLRIEGGTEPVIATALKALVPDNASKPVRFDIVFADPQVAPEALEDFKKRMTELFSETAKAPVTLGTVAVENTRGEDRGAQKPKEEISAGGIVIAGAEKKDEPEVKLVIPGGSGIRRIEPAGDYRSAVTAKEPSAPGGGIILK